MKCEKCKANIPDTAKFCTKCGTKVEIILESDKKTRRDFLSAEKNEEIMANILNLCESDPDAGLEFIEKTIRKSPEAEYDPFGKFAKAIAYGGKGLFQLSQSRPEVDFTGFNEQQFINVLGITDAHLDYLEKGLKEIKEMEKIYPDALKLFGTEKDILGELKVDGMAMVLERCRPGKVQLILEWTKLQYFGTERIWDVLKWDAQKFRPFLNIPLNFSSIIKGVVLMKGGVDTNNRKYIHCMLLGRLPENDETFGDAMIGTIYIFDDRTFSSALP